VVGESESVVDSNRIPYDGSVTPYDGLYDGSEEDAVVADGGSEGDAVCCI
jgi:hypothetical protein